MAESISSISAQKIIRTFCDICEQEEDAKWFCVDCEENLCDGCKHVHLKSKKTKYDNVVTLKEARDDGIPKHITDMCDEHSSFSRDIYCCICESVICLKCLDRHHKSHEWKMILDALPFLITELEKFKMDFTEKLDVYAKCFQVECRIHSDYVSEIDVLKEQVNKKSENILKIISNSRDKLLSQLSSYGSIENKRYAKVSGEYEEKRTSARNLITEIEAELLQQRPLSTVELLKKLKNAKMGIMIVPNKKDFQIPIFVPGQLNDKLSVQILGCIELKPMERKQNEISSTVVTKITTTSTAPDTTSKPKETLHDAPPPKRESILKMCVIKSIKVEGVAKPIRAICPDNKGGAWVAVQGHTRLYQINKDGNVIKLSVDVGFQVQAAAMNSDGELFVIPSHKTIIKKISFDGNSVSTFTTLESIICDLCLTPNDKVAIGRQNPSQICLLGRKGDIIYSSIPKYRTFIVSLTCSTSSKIVAIFRNNNGTRCVRIYSSKLEYLMTWDMNKWNPALLKPSLPTVVGSYVYMVDKSSNVVYTIKEDGSNPKCLQHKHGKFWSFTSDTCGRIWFGSVEGRIHLLE